MKYLNKFEDCSLWEPVDDSEPTISLINYIVYYNSEYKIATTKSYEISTNGNSTSYQDQNTIESLRSWLETRLDIGPVDFYLNDEFIARLDSYEEQTITQIWFKSNGSSIMKYEYDEFGQSEYTKLYVTNKTYPTGVFEFNVLIKPCEEAIK